MVFDTLTIIVCAALLLLTVLSLLADTLFRKVKTVSESVGTGRGEAVSVIVIADNNAPELRSNLQDFLAQDHTAGYEVIVVIAKDEDGTADVLKAFEGNPRLRTTFVPDSSRYMSRRKLAITLGVRAAANEWVLLTDATCRPLSDRWITEMAALTGEGTDMVMGYSNYSDEASRFKRFRRFHREYAFLHQACVGTAYGTAGCNLMFRKSMFMADSGFQGNLKYVRGEYEFLVNKYARRYRTAVAVSPDSFLEETAPTKKEWRNRNIFYAETRRHLLRSFGHRSIFNLDMLSLHTCFLAACATGVFAVLMRQWVVLPFSCVALIVPFLVRVHTAKRAMERFGFGFSHWFAMPFELALVWSNLRYMLAYRFADKYDFICHKS